MRPCYMLHHDWYHNFRERPKTLRPPAESWCKHFCSKNRGCCYCRPLFSNPLLHFSQGGSSTFFSAADWFPTDTLALPRCSFIYALDTPENDSACRRRSSTSRVFTSGTWILQVRGCSGGHILGVGGRQQRRSLVHAVGGHVVYREWLRNDGRLLAAPSLHSARRSSRRLVVGAELLRSSSAGDGSLEEGGAPRCCPPPSDMALGMGRAVLRVHGAGYCAHSSVVTTEGI